jgi:hypothetical protein
LLRLAKRLPAPRRLEIVREALAGAETVGDPFQQTFLLTRAARHLPPVGHHGVLEAALTAARSVDEPISKAEALAMVPRDPRRPVWMFGLSLGHFMLAIE